jgi:putative phosphoribosyl transferase
MKHNAAKEAHSRETEQSTVRLIVPPVTLAGSPAGACGVVLFAHGSGSSRHSPRNRYVAEVLHQDGIGTLLFDLLTEDEEQLDDRTAELRFDIPLT